jgi:hypothetical protein
MTSVVRQVILICCLLAPFVLLSPLLPSHVAVHWHVNLALLTLLRSGLREGASDAQHAEWLAAAQQHLEAGLRLSPAWRWERIRESTRLTLSQLSESELEAIAEYNLGREAEAAGRTAEAAHHYRVAIQRDGSLTAARLALWELSDRMGMLSTAEELSAFLRDLAPQYPAGVGVSDGMVLLGYDVPDLAFLFDSPCLIVLHWSIPEGLDGDRLPEAAAGWQSYRLGDRLFQVGQVENLVRNGGFEIAPGGWPVGFRRQYTRTDQLSPYRLVSARREGVTTRVLCLENGKEISRSGLATPAIRVDPQRMYLATAWMNADQASTSGALLYETSDSGYTNAQVHPLGDLLLEEPWVLRGDVVSLQQSYVRFWMSNFDSAGKVCFDNLLLIPLPPVNSE